MVDETQALERFWSDIEWAGDDRQQRLAVLRRYAEMRVTGGQVTTPPAVRADWEANKQEPPSRTCFACQRIGGGQSTHHVLQVQHGGTNRYDNRVSLCRLCHRAIHPWLKDKPPTARRSTKKSR